jgi:AGCS family alanine or glycine:cation symporter
LVLVIVAGIIFIGGAKRVASVTEKIVPIMAIVYLLGGLVIMCVRITAIPEAIGMIFKFAFTPNAIIGGGIGVAIKTAVSMGAKRGLFSNEAGMGSTPHAHAQANVNTAHEQGCSAMIGVFFDTFVVLTMTALVLISCLYAGGGAIFSASQTALSSGADMNGVQSAISNTGINKNNAITMSIASLFTNASLGAQIGAIFVAVCLTFFAFSTIISWNLFGRINFEYLFGKKSVIIYSLIALAFILLGSVASSDLVWELSDFVNYLMVIPNALALFLLSKTVVLELKENGKKSFKDTPNQPLTKMNSESENN